MKAKDKALRIPIVSGFLRYISPGFACCQKCRLPWNFCRHRSVYHRPGSGTFAVCDICWENSTLEELKSYYAKVYHLQESQSPHMDHTLDHLLSCVERDYPVDKKRNEMLDKILKNG